MTRLAALCLAVVALTLAPGSAARPAGGVLLAFVSAEAEDRLVAVEAASGRIQRRLEVADGPHNVAATADGRFVLVTSPPAGTVTLVDGHALEILKVFSRLGRPHDVEIGPGGRRAYVTEEDRGRVTVIDLVTRRIARSVPVGPRPHDLAVSRNGREVWITHGPRQLEITVLDASNGRVAGRVRAGGAAHDISFSPYGRRVWVTYWGEPRIAAFAARSRRLLFQARAGVVPHHVAVARTRVYVSDHKTGDLLVLSARGRVLGSRPLGPGAHHVAVLRGFVAGVSHDDGALTVYVRGKKLHSKRVGKGLHGLALALIP
jgi:YVTN family beta-propeller protein